MENSHLTENPYEKPLGLCLGMYGFIRIKTGRGKCRQTLSQWSIIDDPHCECSAIHTIGHIASESSIFIYNWETWDTPTRPLNSRMAYESSDVNKLCFYYLFIELTYCILFFLYCNYTKILLILWMLGLKKININNVL